MSNIYSIETEERRQEERRQEGASLWIVRLDRGLTAAEEHELCEWMATDERNKAALLKMAEVWDDSHVLSRLASVFPREPADNRTSYFPRYAVAASILVATLVFWNLGEKIFHTNPGTSADMVQADQGVYETAIGDHSTVKLSDGSKLALNTNTRIRVEFSPGQRLLFLERGEINVEVARDENRPLSVLAGDRIIQAVGTAFSVRLEDSHDIELVVSHGKVLVGVRPHGAVASEPEALPSRPELQQSGLAVEKGDRVVLGQANPELVTLSPEEIEVRLAWTDGNLVFRGESLSEVVNELSRYTPIEFVIQDEDIRSVRVAGMFRSDDVEGFLIALQANFNIAYEHIGDERVVLKSKVAQPTKSYL
jgi:transmembrane sensor